jgi:hypothetical protein
MFTSKFTSGDKLELKGNFKHRVWQKKDIRFKKKTCLLPGCSNFCLGGQAEFLFEACTFLNNSNSYLQNCG